MSARIQVVVDEVEREAFRLRAMRSGMSLSAWLREAGRRRLREETVLIQTPEELRSFFERLPDEEGQTEPDWTEHLDTIQRSKIEGLDVP